MSRMYYDYRDAKVNLYYALKAKGWKMFNFKEDDSDSMTDYYSPASWSPAIAEKNGIIFCCDIQDYDVKSYSGKEIYSYTKNLEVYKGNNKIEKLQAIINDSAATEGERQASQEAISRITANAEQNREEYKNSKVLDYVYPVFMGNPGKSKWHLEKDGKILDKGTGLSKFSDLPETYNFDYETMEYKEGHQYNYQYGKRVKKELREETKKLVEQFNNLITRIDNIGNGCIVMSDGTEETEEEGLEAQQKQGYEKIIVDITKEVTKPVKVDRKEIKEGDILSFSYHGHFWQVTNIYIDSKGNNRIVYECLGSEKRGYQRVKNTKSYYQIESRLLKEIEEGKTSLYEMKTFEEIIPTEKWVKIDKKQAIRKTNNTSKKAEQQEQTKEQEEQTENKTIIDYEYTITADTDTRDNSALWVVRIKDKLSKEEYIKVSESLKIIKGYYSKFKHGFIFKYDPAEALKGNNNNSTEQPNKTEEQAESIIDMSTDIITKLELTSEQYPTNEDYKKGIAEYIQTKKINITDSILAYIEKDFSRLAEILKDIRTGAEQKKKQEQQQTEKTILLEKINKNIESLQSKIDNLSGNYQTNTWKRINEQANRDSKIEGWQLDIEILEWLKDQTFNRNLTVFEKNLIVASFHDSIHSYWRRHEYYNITVSEKRNSTSREIIFPQIFNDTAEWAKENIKKEQKRLNKVGITNTSELIKAVEYYGEIYKQASKPINKTEQKIKKLERELKMNQKGDINFTPSEIALKMVKLAELDESSKVLEPSAGIGNIADQIKQYTKNIDVCEMMSSFRELLQLKEYNLVEWDFLQYNNYNYYDCIIMNPPFSDEQNHIKHAYDLLKEGGKIISITSPHWTFANDKQSKDFRNWFNDMGGEIIEELKSGTFEMTGVTTKIIIITKEAETMQKAI